MNISRILYRQENPDIFPILDQKVGSKGVFGSKAFFYAIWDMKNQRLRINPHMVVPPEDW